MDKNQPIKTLPKPKPNLVTKRPEANGIYNGKKNINGKQANEIKDKQGKVGKTVKYLDHLFSKEFRY